MTKHSEHFIRRRKVLLTLPLIVTPFLTMLFWSLGGGSEGHSLPTDETMNGLNTQIPNAQIKDSESAWDKFALYERAKRDSLQKAEAERTDPYFRLQTITELNEKDSIGLINHSLGKKDFRETTDELAINRKIEEINAVINAPVGTQPPINSSRDTEQPAPADPTIDRLEEMMLMMQSEGQVDPEMEGVESVLDKILDVQHPERVRQRIEDRSSREQGRVFPVSARLEIPVVKSFGGSIGQDTIKSSFITTGDQLGVDDESELIKASIHGDQVLTPGSVVKLELTNGGYINGKKIAQGTFIFGLCGIQNDRLFINVSSMICNGSLVPVSLEVHDFDGIKGLNIPGSTVNDASRQGSDELLQGVQLMSMDPSIGTQAATAGIQTAKTLFSKRNRVVKVHVKSGYNVFLNDTSKK